MQARRFALCFAAALLLSGCADGAAAARTLENRRKEVVLYTTQTNYNSDGTVSSRFVIDHRYDEDGKLLGMDNYDGLGSRWEYLYNGDGMKVSQTFYDPSGQLQSTRFFDLDGNPTHSEGTGTITYADGTTETYTMVTEYTYDEAGRLQEMVTTDDGQESLRETWTYDDTAHTGTRTVVMTDIRGNVSRWTDELTYNEDWQILTSHRSPEGGHRPRDEIYTYDEAGNELSHRTVADNQSEETSTYDENGNLLRVSYTSGGTLQCEMVSTMGTLSEALQRQQSLS